MQNLNTISNYQQEHGHKPLTSQYKRQNSNSQQNLNHYIEHQPPLSAQQSELLANLQNNAGDQHHQWYQSHSGTDGQNPRVVKPHHLVDGGTGSVSKLENSQDQIDSFHQQISSQ